MSLVRRMVFAILICVLSPLSHAQSWPAKPVRMMVGIAPGGGLDTGTRTVANKLSELLGQPIVVENRAGGGGSIAAAAVANAAPDGYTLLMATTTLMIHPAVFAKLPYDPIKSFTPIGAAGTELLVISVNPSVPVKTTAELIALLRANPGKFSFGTPGIGTAHHLAMEMFKKQAGVDIVHVPYKGAALVTPDLISGQIPMAMMSVNTTLPQARAGKIRVIAISSPVKLSVADWPAISETLPGFEASSTRLLMGPANLPRDIVQRLSDGLRRMLASEDIQRAFTQQGAHWQFVGPDELAASMKADLPKWMAAAKDAGVKPE